MSGVHGIPEGITNPPIDELLNKRTSKYALVLYSAKRARQNPPTTPSWAKACLSTSGHWSRPTSRKSRSPSRCVRSTVTC